MPNSSLPSSVSAETPVLPQTPALPKTPAQPPAVRADHPPSVPGPQAGPRHIRKEVFLMFFRLLGSFARSDAVHQARLDAYWNGPSWHLMTRSTWSVK